MPYEDDVSPVESRVVALSDSSVYPSSLHLGSYRVNKAMCASDPPKKFAPIYKNQVNWWFTSPDTWSIDHWEGGRPRVSYSTGGFNRMLDEMHHWLAEWTNTESNPFIHKELYKYRFPRCLQEAYTTLTCYLHKSPTNEDKIYQILEDRAKELVEWEVIATETRMNETNVFDCLEQFAKAQALLIYQLIGLHDGNIRLRYLAEKHIPILHDWIHRLVDQAHRGICYGKSMTVSPAEETAGVANIHNLPDNLLWHSWIVAESIRRTWLITAGVQGMYLALQKKSACLGGQMFTARQGFWEASSAESFERKCSNVYGGFIRLKQADQLFLNISPKELSGFAKVVLECIFGLEQMETLGVQV